MFATTIVTGILLALAAMLPAQALAQFYRPHDVERTDEIARPETQDGFDVFGDRGARLTKQQERPSKAWTMFGRLGPVYVEKDDTVTFKRGGPKLGRLTFGIRKRF